MEAYLGTIIPWAAPFVPKGWAYCNGAVLNLMTNQALFSLLGTRYGGDGRTTFALPNLNGRVAVGAGPDNLLATVNQNAISQAKGAVTLVANNLPAHSHPSTITLNTTTISTSIKVSTSQTGGELVATPNALLTASPPDIEDASAAIYLASGATDPTVNLGGVTTLISATGTLTVGPNVTTNAPVAVTSAFQAVPPYLALNFIICVSGIFPTRN